MSRRTVIAQYNVTVTSWECDINSKEQSRLQVLKSLLSEHVVSDQAVRPMGVRTRYTRRILAAYRFSHVMRGASSRLAAQRMRRC